MSKSLHRFLCTLLLSIAFCTFVSAEDLRSLYPKIEPYQTGFLSVGEGHTIYWEKCGNPQGIPVLFLHGGPGAGCQAFHRSFFDPARYHIILFDQRGCGKSLPFSCLENNTIWDLVKDIEQLREYLGVKSWIVLGGSWGSTLALTYAIKHAENVDGLILRGIFLCRPKEIRWYYQFGAHHIYPDLWEKYCAPIPLDEREDFVRAFYKRLISSDPQVRKEAAKAWAGWEGGTSKLLYDPTLYARFTEDDFADSVARIECHYFINNAFFETDNWIIENIEAIRHIPGVIIQGRYDIPCPIESAWELHRAWPQAKFEVIPNAGHAATEPGILDAIIRATDLFAGK